MIGFQRTLSFPLLLACLYANMQMTLAAQPSALTDARALEARLPTPKLTPKFSFDLSPQRQERLQKLLPDTLRQLSQRETLHLLVLGGAEALEIWNEADKTQPLQTYPAVFARDLAAQFFYTGGVREAGKPALDSLLSPSITIRSLTRAGGSVLEAAAILDSTARQSPVDLVMLCYGQAEAQAGMSPVTFLGGIRHAIEAAHKIDAEVILCAPWLPMSAQAELALGSARSLADALQEFVADEGVMVVDLGDLSRLLELPMNDAKDEGLVFERVATVYRGFFHETAEGRLQPRASLHQQLGSLLFKEMLDGPKKLAWSLTDSSAVWQKDGAGLELGCTVKNDTKQRLDLTLLPLIGSGWKPMKAQPQMSLPAGARQTVTLQYARHNSDTAPVQESVVRLPVLVIAGGQARVETLRAAVQPLAVVWELATLFNQEKRYTVGCQIVNTSSTETRGIWEADFLGQTVHGKFDLKPGATQPLDLSFDLKAEMPPVQTAPLKLVLKGDGLTLTSTRQVTLTRNLGLNSPVSLSAEADTQGDVTLRAQADATRLNLTCELQGSAVLLDANSPGTAAWQIEANVDARSYGKRLESGCTAPIRATGSAVAGKGHVHDIPAWAFGTGYAAGFDAKEIQATLNVSAANTQQVILSLPRTYLYLHEWALSNGNSQLGLNVRLTLNTAQGYRTWTLSPTTKPADDIESLSVLELTDKPTERVTVDVH